MQHLPYSQVRSNFTAIANQVQFAQERCILTKNNKPTVALISVEELALFDKLLEAHEDDLDKEAYLAHKGEDEIPFEQVVKELGIKL